MEFISCPFEIFGIRPHHDCHSSFSASVEHRSKKLPSFRSVVGKSFNFIQGFSHFCHTSHYCLGAHQLDSINLFGFICLFFCSCSFLKAAGSTDTCPLVTSRNMLEEALGLFFLPKQSSPLHQGHNGRADAICNH